MKGIVFNLLQQVVADQYDEATWDAVLDAAELEGAYTAVGSYADEELVALVAAAARLLDRDPDDLVRWFGRRAIPHFAERYPQFFDGHTGTKSFLLTLNQVIHPEVRKLFPGADVPTFDFETPDDRTVALTYVSGRKLCSFAEGLVAGAADHFGETVTISQTQCMKLGDPSCVLVCTLTPLEELVG